MISYWDFNRVKHKFLFYILIFKCWKQFSSEKYLTSPQRQEQHYVRNTFSSHFGDLNEFDCWLKQHSGFWNTDDLERSILRWPDWIYYHIISLIACGLHSTYNLSDAKDESFLLRWFWSLVPVPTLSILFYVILNSHFGEIQSA